MSHHIVIIGSGLAGYILAQEIRNLSKSVKLTMITKHGGEYYSKPTLSNALRFSKKPEALVMKSAEEMAVDLSMNIITHQHVVAVDSTAKLVKLDHQSLSYDSVVFATGASSIFPRQVQYQKKPLVLNNWDDYQALYEKLSSGSVQRVAVLGAGLVGTEIAKDIKGFGIDVDWIGSEQWPMSRFVPKAIGHWLRDAYLANDIKFVNAEVNSIEASNGGYLLNTNTFSQEYDLVVQAFGLEANTELAQRAGIHCDNGIIADQYLRTSLADHYAIGDCLRILESPLFYVRPIRISAKVLAHNMMGASEKVQFPPMITNVKTGDDPLAFSLPPGFDGQGRWELHHQEDSGVSALYYQGDVLCGFAVCGDQAASKNELVEQLPNWLD